MDVESLFMRKNGFLELDLGTDDKPTETLQLQIKSRLAWVTYMVVRICCRSIDQDEMAGKTL